MIGENRGLPVGNTGRGRSGAEERIKPVGVGHRHYVRDARNLRDVPVNVRLVGQTERGDRVGLRPGVRHGAGKGILPARPPDLMAGSVELIRVGDVRE